MNAIETIYRGARFRSRLEARWAAFFDLVSWRWEYEPIDLNGYIPDFVLMFPAGPVLVEVKPAFGVDALIAAASTQIGRSGWSSTNLDDAVILGATCQPAGCFYSSIGPLRQNPPWGSGAPDDAAQWGEGETRPGWPPAWGEGAWISCTQCQRPSIRQELHLWRCISCGAIGKIYGDAPAIEPLWNQAGSAVRWTGPKR